MLIQSDFIKQRRGKQLLMSIAFLFILLGGWFYPFLGYFIPACMALGLVIARFKGRKWCDWYCPRGSFWDYLIKPVSARKEIPSWAKKTKVRIGMLAVMMTIMLVSLIRLWPSAGMIGRFFMTMLTATTLLGIILALLFHQRTWCYLCPVGLLSSWIGKDTSSLKIDSSRCVECRICGMVCPVQIKPYEYKKQSKEAVNDPDCLKCRSCVSACPKKALTL